jgi:uncharacterized protein with HEPN domain
VTDDRLYLIHISECIARIERYCVGGRAAFLSDEKTQDAVIRNLQVMAESSQRLSPALKAVRADIDWRGIAAFRNILTHGYLGVDLNRIWTIVENDVPVLKSAVDEIRRSLPTP